MYADPVRDEDVSPLEHNFLPALVDQEEARDDDRGSDQLADAPHIAHEQRGIRCGAREEIDRQREAVHLGEEGDHEAHVGTVGLPGLLESDRGEGEEEADEKDIQKCLGPEARRHGRTRDEWKTTVKIGVDAGRDLVELVQPDDDQGDDRRHRGDDPLVQCRRRSLARRWRRRGHCFRGPDSGRAA